MLNKGYLEVREPIWNGGKPLVGIAEWRLNNVDQMEIRVAYCNKKGELVYPNRYLIMAERVRRYPTKIVDGNTKVHMVPLSEFSMVQPGHEEKAKAMAERGHVDDKNQ